MVAKQQTEWAYLAQQRIAANAYLERLAGLFIEFGIDENIYIKNFVGDYRIFFDSWASRMTNYSFDLGDVGYIFLYFPGYRRKLLLFELAMNLSVDPDQIEFARCGDLVDFIEENNLKLTEKELEIELYGDEGSDEIDFDFEYNIYGRSTYYQGMPSYDKILRSGHYFKLTRWTYTMTSRKLHLYEKNLKN